MKGNILKFAILPIIAATVLVVPFSSALGDSGATTQDFLIGSGFLCDLDSSACPAIAMAANGDTVEVVGGGTLSIHPKSVTGGGTFVHKDPSGAVLATGTWTAIKLESFHSYGDGSAQGLPDFLFGGQANIRVWITPDGAPEGFGFRGTLTVDCTLGDKIPAGAEEGIRLNVSGLINFNKEISGFTVFVD